MLVKLVVLVILKLRNIYCLYIIFLEEEFKVKNSRGEKYCCEYYREIREYCVFYYFVKNGLINGRNYF